MRKYIEDVPLVQQKPFWCGPACMSMVLKYWGYDHSQNKVFDEAYTSLYGPLTEEQKFKPAAMIGIGNLALAAEQLSPLRVDLWDESKHSKAQLSKPGLAPQDVLRAYIAKDIPCIVRVPHHYNVAVGFDTDKDSFIFNNPSGGRVVEYEAKQFEANWSDNDPNLLYNSSHLLLALRPK